MVLVRRWFGRYGSIRCSIGGGTRCRVVAWPCDLRGSRPTHAAWSLGPERRLGTPNSCTVYGTRTKQIFGNSNNDDDEAWAQVWECYERSVALTGVQATIDGEPLVRHFPWSTAASS